MTFSCDPEDYGRDELSIESIERDEDAGDLKRERREQELIDAQMDTSADNIRHAINELINAGMWI